MRHTLLLFILLVAFNACSSYRFIDIQVLNPSSVKPPVKFDTLVIRGPFENKIASSSKVVKDAANTPFYKLITSNLTSELKKNLEQSPAFADKTIVLLPTVTDSSQYVKANGENLLKLDFVFLAMIDTSYAKNYNFFSPYGYFVIYYKYHFQLINNGKIFDWHKISNSYSWPKQSYDDDGAKALLEICEKVASRYAQRIAPYWSTEERLLFFSANHMMRKAYQLFCDNKLTEAMAIYKNIYEVGTKKLAARAAHNIGLIYEMQDDIESCEHWLVKSNDKKNTPKTSNYIKTIRERKVTRLSLDQQLQ